MISACLQVMREGMMFSPIVGDLKALCKGGRLKEALSSLDLMEQEGIPISWDTYVPLLHGCIKMKALVEGKHVHGHMIRSGLNSNIYVYQTLVHLYTKCGSMLDAQNMFENMAERGVFAWTMMIAGHANLKNAREALRLFWQMEKEGVKPDRVAFLSIIKACASQGAVEQGAQIHLQMIKSGMKPNILIGNSLIDMYGKSGSVEKARRIFNTMHKRDVVSWNTMIAGYARHGHNKEAFDLFLKMEGEGLNPDEITFLSILKACANREQGKQIHGYIIKSGLKPSNFIGNTLVDLYIKCGSMVDAREVFDKMPERDRLVWTMMIAGYTKHGHAQESINLFCRMMQERVQPNEVTFVSMLNACSSLMVLEQGKQVHAQFVKSGIEPNIFVGNTLIDMYAKCGSLKDARMVFDHMPEQDVVSWNAMIEGYSNPEHGEEAFRLFGQMKLESLKPDTATYISILKACACAGVLNHGQSIHAQIIKNGLESDDFVRSTLIDVYAKCGSIRDSHCLFNEMARPDLVSWNALIAGYVQQGQSEEAFKLSWLMEEEGFQPDATTFLAFLKACAGLGDLEKGKQIHALMIGEGFEAGAFVASSLVDMYAKCGSIEDACKVFDNMATRDVVSWNAMITGHAQHGHAEEAFKLYGEIKEDGLMPDAVTFVGVLKACAGVAAQGKGNHIHNDIIKRGLELDVYVGSALVDMYAKCGSVQDAHKVFNKMNQRDAVTWNAMIAGFALHGQAQEALDFFDQMQLAGLEADHITFISVLSACSHAGLLAQAHDYFKFIRKANVLHPTVDHYACVVDLLGRAGLLQDALEFIESMPIQPSAVIWTALLGACRIFGNTKLGVCAAEYLIELDPNNDAAFVQLSNLFAIVGSWEETVRGQKIIQEREDSERTWVEPD